MSFENAYRCIQRRRIREGRIGPRSRAFRPPPIARRTPRGMEFVSTVVSSLLLRHGIVR
jgi:hypothetical protein